MISSAPTAAPITRWAQNTATTAAFRCRTTRITYSTGRITPPPAATARCTQGVLFALLDFIVTLPSLLYLMAVSGAEWMVGMPFLRLIPTAMQVCYVLNFIQMVIRGLFAVYWYKKESERRIHRVYDRCPEGPQRSDALAATGGTSWAAVFIYLGVYIAAGVLGSFLMGPDLNAVIRFLTM